MMAVMVAMAVVEAEMKKERPVVGVVVSVDKRAFVGIDLGVSVADRDQFKLRAGFEPTMWSHPQLAGHRHGLAGPLR